MAQLTEYQHKIQDLLTELAAYGSKDNEVESQLIFDIERNHYQLARVGWRNKHRIYGSMVLWCILTLKRVKSGFSIMALNLILR
jgi:XisI protein